MGRKVRIMNKIKTEIMDKCLLAYYIKKLRELEDKNHRLYLLGVNLEIFEEPIVLILSLLKGIFQDKSDWIDYFIYDLQYGEKYTDGMITYENGDFVKLANVDDLYALLTENLK